MVTNSHYIKRDSRGRLKIELRLDGRKYQLSLNDGAIIVLFDDFRLKELEKVPKTITKCFVATGDAWFPNEKNKLNILKSIGNGRNLTDKEAEIMVDYLHDRHSADPLDPLIREAILGTKIQQYVDASSLQFANKSSDEDNK